MCLLVGRIYGAYGSIAVPKIHVDLGQRLASIGVEDLDVHVQRDTLLVLDEVLTDQLAGDI